MNEAARRGAKAFVLPPGHPAPAGATWFEVEDTLAAYRLLAGAWRRRFDIPVATVVGSVGKTTTKDLLAHALGGKFRRVLRTRRSENGFVGTAATVMNLRPAHDAAVVEIGIDEVGAMEQHLELVRPTIAVVTRLGAEHLRGLGSVESAAHEELLAIRHTERAGGIAVVNLDEPWCALLGERTDGPRIHYSAGRPAFALPSSATLYRGTINDGTIAIDDPAGEACSLRLPLPGGHNGENLLAAFATARTLGLSCGEVERGLRTFRRGPRGRSEIRRLDSGAVVICDYMNASPVSMAAGLRLLRELASGGRRSIACLGDMLDLGEAEQLYHEQLGDVVRETRPDVVLTVGERMAHLCRALRETSFAGEVRELASVDDLTNALAAMLRPADVVLIKGSRGMHMEAVWSGICHVRPEP